MTKECIQDKPEDISELLYEVYDVPSGICEQIENMVQRLKAIENADPSDALECLEWIIKNYIGNDYYVYEEELITIKQALTKVQEQKDKVKAFDLINEKNIDIKLLKWAYPDLQAYNQKVRVEKDYWWRKELTQEEFEFIGKLAGAK